MSLHTDTVCRERRYKVTIRLGADTKTHIVVAAAPKAALKKAMEQQLDNKTQFYSVIDIKRKDRRFYVPNVVVKKIDGVQNSVKYYRIKIMSNI